MKPYRITQIKTAIADEDGERCYELLTDLQKEFCHEYLKDLNASRACIRAGYQTDYPNRVGSELKNKPNVKLALNWLKKQRAEELAIDATFVIEKIVKSLDRSEQKENEAAVLRAAELLGKHLGVFVERTEISGPDGDAIELRRKIDKDAADFASSISRLAKKGGEGEAPIEDDEGSESGS